MPAKPGLTERACPHCREPVAATASRCPNCRAEFTAEDVQRTVSANVQGILFGLICLSLLLMAVMWWQERYDAAAAAHLNGIENGTIDPLTDQPK